MQHKRPLMEEAVDRGEVIVKTWHAPIHPGRFARHVRRNPAWQTHEFPKRLVIRQLITGRLVEFGAEVQVDVPLSVWTHAGLAGAVAVPGPRWARDGPVEVLPTYRYKCPRCRCDLQLRSATMLPLIGALDSMERERRGKQAGQIQRLDISTAEQVLTFRPSGRQSALAGRLAMHGRSSPGAR